jgi:prevent-host-death family protein
MVRTAVQRTWQVAEAKAKLSKLLDDAARDPQLIERRGTPVAVVLGIEAYRAATEQLAATSAEERMRGFLERCAALRADGGITLAVPRRVPRPSPFEES